MSSPSTIFSLLLLLLLSTKAFSYEDLVTKTCKEASKNNKKIDYNFCVNALKSYPTTKSCTNGLTCLGKVSLTLVKNNVSKTTSMIQTLLKNNDKAIDPNTKAVLADCSDLYVESSSTIDEATKDFMANRLNDANSKVSSVMTSVGTCEEGFQDLGVGSSNPLTKQNDNASNLCSLALYIMKSVNKTS
ncbi:putative invertase inhibitor [Spinacia oleracea]|uniref:Invertase inhibitor n=1 Tax=Spinacia oleracea TaxID=3562 RepID=A0ABM3R6X8_SPIOL|nr:putative invertase inhibitor [Spinacia oleracea]